MGGGGRGEGAAHRHCLQARRSLLVKGPGQRCPSSRQRKGRADGRPGAEPGEAQGVGLLRASERTAAAPALLPFAALPSSIYTYPQPPAPARRPQAAPFSRPARLIRERLSPSSAITPGRSSSSSSSARHPADGRRRLASSRPHHAAILTSEPDVMHQGPPAGRQPAPRPRQRPRHSLHGQTNCDAYDSSWRLMGRAVVGDGEEAAEAGAARRRGGGGRRGRTEPAGRWGC